ncbi:HAD-IA family hydrolase [Kitasatospora sp. LaBMicrA B282]
MAAVVARSSDEHNGYRGLILDFAGVLTTGVLESQQAWAEHHNLAPGAWRAALNDDPEGRRLYAALEVGEISQVEWNASTAPLLGVQDGANLMGRAWAGVQPALDMIKLARAARTAGLTVAMLSNSFGLEPFDPYAHVGVWDLFDVTVISEHERIAKPHPEIYQRCLDRMGLRGEQCVFVDDHLGNLPPAEALGITTVHADGQGDTVARVAELLGLVPAAGS